MAANSNRTRKPRNRTSRWIRRLGFGLAAVALLLGLGGAGLVVWMRKSLPEISGEIRLRGLEGPVAIARDARGVPHIRAAAKRDAYFALGFVHAQDRLFQMDLFRRLGQGRLAEIVGAPGVRSDRLMRTLGLYRRSQASVAALPEEVRAMYEAYAAGVNAWAFGRSGALPPEYTALGLSFEPWTAADSVLWGKNVAVLLSASWRQELLRLRILKAAGADALATLFPPERDDTPVSVGRLDDKIRPAALERLWAALPHALIGMGASNAWAVSGARSEDGKPLLANDPHLPFSAPGLWYLAELEAPDVHLSGATIPGAPVFVLGHNGHVAWGATASYVDTDDIIVEQVDPDDSMRYLTPAGPERFTKRTETIVVRFGTDLTLEVRETRNGPVLDGVVDGEAPGRGTVLALKATWLDERDGSAEGFLLGNWSRNWREFNDGLSRVVAPSVNFTYADIEGNIGFITVGRIPLRASLDGFMPTPGWSPGRDWVGFVPFDSLPRSFNPPSGVIVSANNRIAGAEYPYFLSRDWGDHRRARRISALLDRTPKHSVESMRRIQADIVSRPALELVAKLALPAQPDRQTQRAVAMLRDWDGAMRADRPEPLIYHAWLGVLVERLLVAKTGIRDRYFHANAELVLHVLAQRPDWCGPAKEAETNPCVALLWDALSEALASVRRDLGDPEKARWGDVHEARFDHPILAKLPGLAAWSGLRIAVPGDNYTVNRAATFGEKPGEPYATRHGAGYRGIYPLSNLSLSVNSIATGQSGNPFSKHYGDALADWSKALLQRHAAAGAERDRWPVLKLTPLVIPPRASLD